MEFENVEQILFGNDENTKPLCTISRKIFYELFIEAIRKLCISKLGVCISLKNFAPPSLGNLIQKYIEQYGLMMTENNDQYSFALCKNIGSDEDEEFIPLVAISVGSSEEQIMWTSYAAYSLLVLLMFYMQTSAELAMEN